MKNKFITLAIVVAVFVIIIICNKFFPLWSSIVNMACSVLSFCAGWFARRWYEQYRNSKNE